MTHTENQTQQMIAAIDHILRVEGAAYTNHPSDRGGPTKYGITLATLSRVRGRTMTAADVQRLTEKEARDIYYQQYVLAPNFDDVRTAKIALELIDSGVNVGPGLAARWLQRSLNLLNRKAQDFADLVVDGDIGPATLRALDRYLTLRGGAGTDGELVLFRLLNTFQGMHYITITEGRELNEDFLFGWFRTRIL